MDIKSCSEENADPVGISEGCGPVSPMPKDTVEMNGKSQAMEGREIRKQEYGLEFNVNLWGHTFFIAQLLLNPLLFAPDVRKSHT